MEVRAGVGPGDEDVGVGVFFWDWNFDIIGVERDGEALETLDVELDGGGVEEFHYGGCG